MNDHPSDLPPDTGINPAAPAELEAEQIWQEPASTLLTRLRTRTGGLDSTEAQARLATFGPNDAATVKRNPLWIFEGLVFRVDAPDATGNCPADRVPVVRMYNNGKGGQANHRYLTSHSETAEMLREGWIVEGTVFCSLP